MTFLQIHIAVRTGKTALLTAMLFSFNDKAMGQGISDTLQEVNIRHKKEPKLSADERINSFSNGQKIVTADSLTLSLYKMQSVANLLSQRLPVFVKSYGINGLATLNIRGSSAAQSQVVWNGVPINNAAMGLSDLSILPVSMLNKLHLVYGSSAALWGSGNIGGALMLESDTPVFQKTGKYEAAFGMGSFNQYQGGSKIILGSSRFSSISSVFAQTAANDFAYNDNLGAEQKTKNARIKGIALQQLLAYRLDQKNTWRIAGWLQQYEREIPAALFEAYSGKARKDRSLRIMGEWNRKTVTTLLYARAALLMDNFLYNDDTIGLHSENTTQQYFIEIGWKRKFNVRHQVLVFTPAQLSRMLPDSAGKKQKKYALALAYSYNDLRNRFRASANLRGEQIDGYSILLPGVSASYHLTTDLQVNANIQKTFRAPTLNELYYEPGGNVQLKPEQGWSAEAGYSWQAFINPKISIKHDVSMFGRLIHDWIIWLGGSIWTPHNIATVYSRGVETENSVLFSMNEWKLHFGINAAYVAATTTSSYLPYDGSINKQIPYTPKFNGQLNFGFTFRRIYFNYNWAYTGVRFVNVDETGKLNAYSISNIQINYSISLGQRQLSLFGLANNIFNTSYEVVSARPMPGINWQAGLVFRN